MSYYIVNPNDKSSSPSVSSNVFSQKLQHQLTVFIEKFHEIPFTNRKVACRRPKAGNAASITDATLTY